MGLVVTVMNMKGGVGKTTVCMHIGGMLGRIKFATGYKKVLLIDYDPQFNMSQAFLRSKRYFELEDEGKTCLSILQDKDSDLDPFEIQTPSSATPPNVDSVIENLLHWQVGAQIDLVPSTLALMYIALGTSTGNVSLLETRFKTFIEQAKKQYDLVMIDCHPAGSFLTKTSLQNSDHVLIPVAPQRYAARGVALMLKFIESNKVGNVGPQPHIVFNLIPRSGKVPDIERDIRRNSDFAPLCLTRRMKKYKVYAEPEEGRGFVWISGKPYSTEALTALRLLANEFAAKINL